MAHPFLKILPGTDNLRARLSLFMFFGALLALVLGLLAFLQIIGATPVDMETTFAWVVLGGALASLLFAGVLWLLISREVLRPLEQIRTGLEEEERGAGGLGQVAATMRELRDTVHRTQAELDESHKNLRQVEKLALVGKLAAGVAHSVRNPLTSVKLRLFSLERSLSLNARQEEDFTVIAEAVRHVDGIVGNFLEFSRRPRLSLRTISPALVVDGALRLLENRVATFPVSLTVTRAPKLPDIYADPEQLREALLNILLNACEAMEYSGNLYVEEKLLSYRDSGLFVAVTVRDSGPGIPAEILHEIFTPFFSTKEQGTGLGLPIAKGILEEHGGDLLVESSAKTGSLFTLLIPVAHMPKAGTAHS